MRLVFLCTVCMLMSEQTGDTVGIDLPFACTLLVE